MKRWFVLALMVVLSWSAVADDDSDGRGEGRHGHKSDYLGEEIEMILGRLGNRAIGDLTVNELTGIYERMSIAIQKEGYVRKSKAMSAMVPGFGQFMNGDTLGGILYLTADVAVAAGSMIGAYFLLPSELQFTSLNYFNESHSTIKAFWESQSIEDLLPAMGVAAGGSLVHMLLRIFASKHAAELAHQNIADGKIAFDAKIEPQLLVAADGLGLGVSISY